MKNEKPIKSPFMPNAQRVVRHDEDVVESGKEHLAKFLTHLDRLGEKIETSHGGGFFAGFQAGLLAIGLPKDVAKKLANDLLDEVDKIRTDGCGKCENCLANKKANKKSNKK
jgi:hypothetical protein